MRTEAKLDFGKYRGLTLAETLDIDWDWVFKTFPTEPFRRFLRRHGLRARIGLALPEQARFVSVFPLDAKGWTFQ